MVNWGGTSKAAAAAAPTAATAPSQAVVSAPAYGLSKEFQADNVTRLPTPDASLAVAARLRRELLARSGRESTRLVGAQVYTNAFLGDTG